ncbi:hypothetical protein QYM36_018956, partial [Artemia franciscana]
ITYQFISLDDILWKFDKNIKLSQNYTTGGWRRYRDVTLHIRPLYPKVLTYKRVAILDIDVEFRASFYELYKNFENMNSYQIAALAYDQTPYYRQAFKKYRERNKGTNIGSPSPGFQEEREKDRKEPEKDRQEREKERLASIIHTPSTIGPVLDNLYALQLAAQIRAFIGPDVFNPMRDHWNMLEIIEWTLNQAIGLPLWTKYA